MSVPVRQLGERLGIAEAIVREAAALALRFRADLDHIHVAAKHPQDFVSEADTAVETLIREALARAFPGEDVMGEEMGGEESESYWVIDPIDGTSNFLRGSPLWGISLAHVEAGRPDIGVIAHPAFDDLLSAADGAGLFLNGTPALPRPDHGVRAVSLGDASRDEEQVGGDYIRLRRAGYIVESFRCSTIGLSFAARGILDGHIQRVTTMWDAAGGAVLCREAGLSVTLDRNPVTGKPSILAANAPLAATLDTFAG